MYCPLFSLAASLLKTPETVFPAAGHEVNKRTMRMIQYTNIMLLCSSFTAVNEVILALFAHFVIDVCYIQSEYEFLVQRSKATNESAAEAGRESAHTCQRCRKALL